MSFLKNRFLIILGILLIGIGYFVSRPPLAKVENGIYVLKGVDTGDDLIWSPDGNYLAGYETVYPWPDCPVSPLFCIFAPEPYSEVFLIDTTKWERKSIIRTEFYDRVIYSISWYPDSKHIAYHSDNNQVGNWGEVRLIDITGQSDMTFMEGSRYVVWSPNGTKLASIETEGVPGDWYPAIYIIDLSTNQKEQVFIAADPISQIFSLSWSSDGKLLAFSYGKLTMENPIKFNIFIFDDETKQTTQFTDDEFEYHGAFFSPTDNLITLQRFDNQADFEYQHTTAIRDLISDCEIEIRLTQTFSSSWSPDGEKLVITGLGNTYIIDLLEFTRPKFGETGSICP